MKKSGTLLGKQYILLCIVSFFSWLSYDMVTPVLTGYMETLGASVSVCGVVAGLFAFTSLFSRPVSGIMSDTMNRKRLLAVFTFLMAISLCLYSLIPSIPLILLFRGIHGISFGISSTASLVLVSDCVPEERIGEAVSYYGVISVAALAIGPSLGIWMSSAYGYRICMIISTAMLMVAAVTAMVLPYEYQRNEIKKEVKKILLPNQMVETKLIGLSGVNASFTMLNGVISTYIVVFATERGIQGVGWYFAINAIVLILSRILMARKMNRWSLKKNLYPAFACGVLTLLLIAGSSNLFLLIIAAIVKAFAQGMSQPALQTEALRIVEPDKRGIACSTMYIGGDLGQAVGPMLGGIVAQSLGYGSMYLFSIIPLVAAFIYFTLWNLRFREANMKDNPVKNIP